MKSSLDRARELLDAMEARHQDRLERKDLGDWQTEINEVRRILVYLLDYAEVREFSDEG